MNQTTQTDNKPRLSESVWWLTISPSVWAAHLLISYVVAAIYCAKAESDDVSLLPLRIMVTVLSVAALGVILWVGKVSYQRHLLRDSSVPSDFDSRMDQHSFLGFAAFLLSLLSSVATVYTAMVFLFIGTCN